MSTLDSVMTRLNQEQKREEEVHEVMEEIED